MAFNTVKKITIYLLSVWITIFAGNNLWAETDFFEDSDYPESLGTYDPASYTTDEDDDEYEKVDEETEEEYPNFRVPNEDGIDGQNLDTEGQEENED